MEPCPACGTELSEISEELGLERLARAWSSLDPGAGDELRALRRRGEIPGTVRIAHCRACSLEYGAPRFMVDSGWYERFEKYGPRWEYGAVLGRLGSVPKEIVEIGCGEGFFLKAAREAGHHGIGLDFNASAVECARAQGLDARVGDLRELQNQQGKFDAIALFHVIEHVGDPRQLLEDLGALARTGTTLHISCPGPNRYTTALFPQQRAGRRDVWDYPPFHQTRWNARAFERVLERTGWRLLAVEEEPMTWLSLNANVLGQDPKYRASHGFARKVRLGLGLLRTALPALHYRGMSILVTAVRP